MDSRNNIGKDAKHRTAFEYFKLCEVSKQDIRRLPLYFCTASCDLIYQPGLSKGRIQTHQCLNSFFFSLCKNMYCLPGAKWRYWIGIGKSGIFCHCGPAVILVAEAVTLLCVCFEVDNDTSGKNMTRGPTSLNQMQLSSCVWKS